MGLGGLNKESGRRRKPVARSLRRISRKGTITKPTGCTA